MNADGKALRRSYFVGTLLKMFPEKTVEEIEETTYCGLHHDAEEQHGVFPGGTAG